MSAGTPVSRDQPLGRFRGYIVRNFVSLIVLIVFAITEYGNYTLGRDLSRICDLTGPHDVEVEKPQTVKQAIDNICVSREAQE